MARNSNFQGISLVPQCRTLAFLNLADLIDYSLISPATKDLVRYYHKRCDRMVWIIGANGDYRIDLTDEFNTFLNGKYYSLLLDFSSNVPEGSIPRIFGDWELTSQKIQGYVKAWCSENDAIKILESFSRELLELFRIRQHVLKIGYVDLEDNLDIFQRLPRFERVEVVGDNDEDELSSEVMDFLMNQLDCDLLDITSCGVDSEYEFDGHLNLKRFWTDNVDWITRESMLRMSCQRLHISKGSDHDISLVNALIKEWLTGGLENLELLSTGPFHVDDMDMVMEDIDCIDFDSAIHQGEFEGEDVSDGYYFARGSDGMVATVYNYYDDDGTFKWIIWR